MISPSLPLDAQALGIPTLDLAMQADELVCPVTKWGTISRQAPMTGTYHFYTSDYKFSNLARRPWKLSASGCAVAVEPNYSTWPGQPLAEVLADVSRKRRLAREWQSQGVRVVVDLNVEPEFREANFLGVPQGWASYAVRCQAWVDWSVIEADHQAATERAGGGSIVFIVYGGGKRAAKACEARGWIHVPEERHVREGRAKAYGTGSRQPE